MKWHLGVPAALSCGALAVVANLPSEPVAPSAGVQPIAFNHKLHHEQGLGCLDCHTRAEEGRHATLPSIKGCMLCHAEAQGEHPDEERLRQYAEDEGGVPWVQVNRYAGHVYFSHAAHVRFAKMDCAECHGDMTLVTEPVSESQIEGMTMGRCMECHAEERVSNDCLVCHK